MVKKGLMIAMIAAVFLLGACSGNAPDGSGAAGGDAGQASSNAGTGGAGETAAADPFGRYEETVKVSIGQCTDPTNNTLPDGDTPEDNVFVRNVEETLNVDIEYAWSVACGANWDQKLGISIASGDLPDAMVVNQVQLRAMVEAGQLADLTEVYEKYAAPGVKDVIDATDGFAIDAATFDGKLMAIPGSKGGADGVHLMYMRKDWLDKLGLEPPQTIEEYETAIRMMTENDPDGNGKNDTFGLSGPQSGDGKLNATFLKSGNNLYGFDPIFSAYDAHPGYWLEGADGKPVYGSILPETKEALAKLREWYASGWIDPEMGIRKDAAEPVVAGQSGMFSAPWWMGYGPVVDMLKNNPQANLLAYTGPLDKDGEFNPHINAPTTEFLVVRKGFEHPEAIVKIENVVFRDSDRLERETGLDPGLSPLRLVLSRYDKFEGSVKLLQEVLAGEKPKEVLEDQPYDPNLPNELDAILKVKLEPYDNPSIEYWNPEADWAAFSRAYCRLVGVAPLVDKPMNKVGSLIYSQTKSMESRWANLEKLEAETFMKIIMGSEPIEAFDKFVEDWKKQGGDQITAEVEEFIKES